MKVQRLVKDHAIQRLLLLLHVVFGAAIPIATLFFAWANHSALSRFTWRHSTARDNIVYRDDELDLSLPASVFERALIPRD